MREPARKSHSEIRFSSLLLSLLLLGTLVFPKAAAQPIFQDGFEAGDTSAWTLLVGPWIPPQPFRFSDLDLRDPHLFVDATITCFDFTDTDLPFGLGPSFNGQVEDLLTLDGDGDGFLDASFLLLFRPLEISMGGSRPLELDGGLCTEPIATTVCGPDPATARQFTSYVTPDFIPCLAPLPGTTSGYVPGIEESSGLCFQTPPQTLSLDLNGVTIPLQAAQIAATYDPPPSALLEPAGAPVTALTEGLLSGFLSEADADMVLLPPDLPIVGGQPLSVLLPGGTGNCATGDDRDVFLGQSGWWFYLNFSATEVVYTGL